MRVRDRDDADVPETLREAADRVGRQDPLRDATVERQRPDRDRERRQAEARDQEAVERPEHPAEQDRSAHGGPDRPTVVEELGHEESGQAEHRGDREVDFAGDDDEGQGKRDDRDLAHVETDEEEVRRLQEVRRDARAVGDPREQQDDEERLPAEQAGDASPIPPLPDVSTAGTGASGSATCTPPCAHRGRDAYRDQPVERDRGEQAARPRAPCSRTTRRSRRRARVLIV